MSDDTLPHPSVGQRVRGLLGVRLGVLVQHPPAPLRVPWPVPPVRDDALPKLTIVTPSFGQGRFIGRTLDSVLGQCYPALQCIVQDGGSHDETAQEVAARACAQLSFRSAPDGGQADALNRGFASADGEILAYLNSDDVLIGDCLPAVGAYFRDHPEVDVVYGNRLLIDVHDRQIGRWLLPGHDARVLEVVDYVPQETLFWRRRAWDAVGARFDPDARFALDWELLLRMVRAGVRFRHLPWLFGGFRVHAAQKTVADHRSVGRREMAALRPRSRSARWQAQLAHLRFLARHVALERALQRRGL